MSELTCEHSTVHPKASWRDYLILCKPKVVLLMLVTAIVGMLLASNQAIPWQLLVFGNLGIALAASSAAVINHILEQNIDAKMLRTYQRPMPSGKIPLNRALTFSICLGIASMVILMLFTNMLTTALTLITLIGYALVYTLYLKPATPQNIVIGGLTGAAPPLLGWSAVTASLDPHALLLVLIIFTWTPPHFWALAIHRYADYSKIQLPMLPITHGIAYTKLSITLYTILLFAITMLPFVVRMSGVIYLVGAVILNIGFLYHALKLQFGQQQNAALTTFRYSICYLFLLFSALLVDHYLI